MEEPARFLLPGGFQRKTTSRWLVPRCFGWIVRVEERRVLTALMSGLHYLPDQTMKALGAN